MFFCFYLTSFACLFIVNAVKKAHSRKVKITQKYINYVVGSFKYEIIICNTPEKKSFVSFPFI